MFYNYLKSAIRRLAVLRTYAAVNIIGLALGLATFLVIWHYVAFERSFDNFHANADNIYRALFTSYQNGEKTEESSRFGFGLGPAIQEDLPEIETYTRVHGLAGDHGVVSVFDPPSEAKVFDERQLLFVDSTFLRIFSFDAVTGNPATALDNPSSVVLTESAARRYFGKEEGVGKTIHVATKNWVTGDYVVTAVLKDVPANSHLQFELLLPMQSLLQVPAYRQPKAKWNWVNFDTYVSMRPGARVADANAKTDPLLTKYTGPNDPGSFIFTFQPLLEIHQAEKGESIFSSNYLFLLIGLIALVVAWINYVNLATAVAVERAREVGIRKVTGALKGQLVGQFLVESLVINFIAMVLALTLTILALPLINTVVNEPLSFPLTGTATWIVLGIALIIGTLAAGLYPAYLLSSLKTLDGLRGNRRTEGTLYFVRRSLTVFQLTASLLLVTGVLVIYRQIQYMKENSRAYADHLLVVDGPRVLEDRLRESSLDAFKNQVKALADVDRVTVSGSVPGENFDWITGVTRLGDIVEPSKRKGMEISFVDPDFVQTYGIELIAGTPARVGLKPESVLINEAALLPFGLQDPEHALDQRLIVDFHDTVTIAGVFRNVHWESLRSPYAPMLLWPSNEESGKITARLHGNVSSSVERIARIYKQLFPGNPFAYYFLNDALEHQYQSEERFGKMIAIFCSLTVIIACLGLWGLASFTAVQRRREIGIRRVLGATVINLLALLSSQYVRLLAVACLIAFPAGWLLISSWLSNFAFRSAITWDLFVVPVLLIFFLVLSTIGAKTISAVVANPVESLKHE